MSKFTVLSDALDTIKSWSISLRNLSVENVRGYEWSGTITFGTEKVITHNLGVIPTRFILTSAEGTVEIVKGDTRPTNRAFYVKNVSSAVDFTGKILIMP